MNRIHLIYLMLITAVMLCLPGASQAVDLDSRYAKITYADDHDLKKFNKELYMGRLKSRIKKGGGDTIEDEVISKINFIVEKIMGVLDMFPAELKFSIVIQPDERAVQKDFKSIYNIDVGYIAFYSPSRNKVFYSANNANLRVVAHEIGHVVAENYFNISPPQKIHEVLAQFAEQHVTD